VELGGEELSCYLNNIQSAVSLWSLCCQQSVFQRYHNEKHLWELYPQDGGERQLELKLRHCHPMYQEATEELFTLQRLREAHSLSSKQLMIKAPKSVGCINSVEGWKRGNWQTPDTCIAYSCCSWLTWYYVTQIRHCTACSCAQVGHVYCASKML